MTGKCKCFKCKMNPILLNELLMLISNNNNKIIIEDNLKLKIFNDIYGHISNKIHINTKFENYIMYIVSHINSNFFMLYVLKNLECNIYEIKISKEGYIKKCIKFKSKLI